MSGKFCVALTRSQQMALIDVIVEFIRESLTDSFTDCSTNPATVTTPGELLRLISDAPFFADGGLIRNEPANENAGPKARTV